MLTASRRAGAQLASKVDAVDKLTAASLHHVYDSCEAMIYVAVLQGCGHSGVQHTLYAEVSQSAEATLPKSSHTRTGRRLHDTVLRSTNTAPALVLYIQSRTRKRSSVSRAYPGVPSVMCSYVLLSTHNHEPRLIGLLHDLLSPRADLSLREL